MSKRPESVSTALVLLELLRRIPRGRKVTALELHEQLSSAGVVRDIRSIQRLLDELCERFDIHRDTRSKPYGYCWKEQARGFAVPMLGEHESLLLMLAQQQLRNLLPASLMKSMDGFFEQARINLGPTATPTREAEWLRKVRVVNTTQPLLPPEIAPAVFEAVSDALYGNRWLDVRYRNAHHQVADYRVMPLGLAQQGTRLYLVCRFESFENERNLALNRMEWASATEFEFERPDFELQRYVDEGRFGFGSGEKIRLSFWIERESGVHLTESRLSVDQECVEEGDGFRITATVVDTEVLDWWLKGFGERVRDVERRPLAKALASGSLNTGMEDVVKANGDLLELYERYSELIVAPVHAWPDRDLNGPFMTAPESYWGQSTRLLVIGQETGGWSKNHNAPVAQMEAYRDFELGRHYKVTPFWDIARKLEVILGVEPYGCAWSNLNRYDEAGRSPSAEVERSLRPLDSLLREEIRILRPDVCVLFTNRKYDDRLSDVFSAVHFEAIQGLPENHFKRLVHPDLPRLTFRCPHPRTIRVRKWEDDFLRVMERLCKGTTIGAG